MDYNAHYVLFIVITARPYILVVIVLSGQQWTETALFKVMYVLLHVLCNQINCMYVCHRIVAHIHSKGEEFSHNAKKLFTLGKVNFLWKCLR